MVSSERGLRRDAQENRDKLIDTARRAFSERGVDIPLNEVARLANVGVGTLYRRFPTRADLNAAVFADLGARMVRLGEAALDEPDGWKALSGYVEELCSQIFTDRGASGLSRWAAVADPPELDKVSTRVRDIVDVLVQRGQSQGTIRQELSAEDVLTLISIIRDLVCVSAATVEHAWRRTLSIMLDGLRPHATPLPEPEVTPDEFYVLVREFSQR